MDQKNGRQKMVAMHEVVQHGSNFLSIANAVLRIKKSNAISTTIYSFKMRAAKILLPYTVVATAPQR